MPDLKINSLIIIYIELLQKILDISQPHKAVYMQNSMVFVIYRTAFSLLMGKVKVRKKSQYTSKMLICVASTSLKKNPIKPLKIFVFQSDKFCHTWKKCKFYGLNANSDGFLFWFSHKEKQLHSCHDLIVKPLSKYHHWS